MFGRPLVATEYAATLGDRGDLVLGDWSQYLEGTLQGPTDIDSAFVRFSSAERCFRFSMRNDGAPWWSGPLTPKNSATTISPFVVLAARA